MKNRVEDLRNILFAQLEKLSDCDEKDLEEEVQRSESMCSLAEQIINSARAQTEFLSKIEGGGIDFYQKKLPDNEIHSNESDNDLVPYGNKMISKKTLGNHTTISASKDV